MANRSMESERQFRQNREGLPDPERLLLISGFSDRIS